MTATETALDRPGRTAHLDGEESVSLCLLLTGAGRYGIDTRRIREVLGGRIVQRVPLAPAYIGGMVPYRGEVLTAVSFRALLGLPRNPGQSVVLVLDDAEERESFGLMVDAVGGVVTVRRRLLAANPTTLDERGKALFDGAYPTPEGLLVQLDSHLLRPARLGETGLFGGQRGSPAADAARFHAGNGSNGNGSTQEATCAL